jgi:hypothetical protein
MKNKVIFAVGGLSHSLFRVQRGKDAAGRRRIAMPVIRFFGR